MPEDYTIGVRIAPEEIPDLEAKWCSEESTWWWGAEHKIDPQLLPLRYGDALCAIAIYPINDRPNFYVALIDSRFSGHSHMPEEWWQMLDALEFDIEEHFGDCGCNGCDECESEGKAECDCREWPSACFCCGASWGEFYETRDAIAKAREAGETVG